MPSRIVAAGAALTVAAATLIAAPAADAAGRGTTHVKVTSEHTVSAPASLRPGVVHLRNDGKRPILVFRKKKDDAAKLVKYLGSHKTAEEKKIFTRFGFVEFLMPKADDYVTLNKGTYYLVAAAGAKPKLKGVRSVIVKGHRVNAVRPTYRNLYFSKNGAITGAHTAAPRPYLRVRNLASASRFISSLPVKASATDAQVKAALADKTGSKFTDIVDYDNAGHGVSLFLGGKQDVTTRTELARGRYLIMSFGESDKTKALPQFSLLTVR